MLKLQRFEIDADVGQTFLANVTVTKPPPDLPKYHEFQDEA